MRSELFQPTIESEARLLLLIEVFSRRDKYLEGRTKLAKLDFFLRYPVYFYRALKIRNVINDNYVEPTNFQDVETRMVRYRYGPWDPSYYAILGRLIGKGLVVSVPLDKGIGYKVTDKGREIAKKLSHEPTWNEITLKLEILKKNLNLSGTTLKKFIYDNFPEVTKANWGQLL